MGQGQKDYVVRLVLEWLRAKKNSNYRMVSKDDHKSFIHRERTANMSHNTWWQDMKVQTSKVRITKSHNPLAAKHCKLDHNFLYMQSGLDDILTSYAHQLQTIWQ